MSVEQMQKTIVILGLAVVVLGSGFLGGIFVYNKMINKYEKQNEVLAQYNKTLNDLNTTIVESRKECNSEFRKFWRENLKETKKKFQVEFENADFKNIKG